MAPIFFRNFLRQIRNSLFYILDLIIPKNQNLIVFGCKGKRYYDNARYLFEYKVSKTQNKLDVIWVTFSSDVLNLISEKYGSNHVIKVPSLKGFWIFLRAKVVVFSHGFRDFGWLLSQRSPKLKVCTWHGSPIKKIAFANKFRDMKRKEKPIYYDFLSVSSRIEKYVINYCFGYSSLKRNIHITGTPRNDILLEKAASTTKIIKSLFLNKISPNPIIEKIILYAPTYRDPETSRFFPFEDFNQNELLNVLQQNQAVLLLRGHFNDINFDISRLNKLTNNGYIVEFHQQQFPDIQDVLHLVDILITDYSSMYIDFLLLDRPTIFIPYDLDEYRERPGLLYPYNSIIAGDVVNTWNEFLEALGACFRNPRRYSSERIQISKLFHEAPKGKARKLIWEWIESNLGKKI